MTLGLRTRVSGKGEMFCSHVYVLNVGVWLTPRAGNHQSIRKDHDQTRHIPPSEQSVRTVKTVRHRVSHTLRQSCLKSVISDLIQEYCKALSQTSASSSSPSSSSHSSCGRRSVLLVAHFSENTVRDSSLHLKSKGEALTSEQQILYLFNGGVYTGAFTAELRLKSRETDFP